MPDFWSSEAGRHIVVAVQYLEAAVTLDEAQRIKGRILFRPTLALAGQGLELMLKASMYWNDVTPPTRGRSGHDIHAMWNEDVCEPVRGNLFKNAIQAVIEARDITDYQQVPEFGENETDLIEQYIRDLAKLHGEQQFPLRYPTDDQKEGPVTPWLVKSLRMTADDFVKRPADFNLARFRGSSMPAE